MIPDLTVVWVVVFVLILVAALDRLLLSPLRRVMHDREQRVRSARDLAEASARKADAAMREFEEKIQAARAEVYREMDEKRRAALDRRAALLADTRHEAEAEVAAAMSRLQAETENARAALQRDADALAGDVVERVLGRKAS